MWSLVLAIGAALLSPTPFGGVTALFAVIFGHDARREIKAGQRSGDGYAIAGLILGYLVLAPVLLTWLAERV